MDTHYDARVAAGGSASTDPAARRIAIYRWLTLTLAVAVYLLAILGSWVRVNGAGMTCPDWPTCRGVWLPNLHGPVFLEWFHRLIAGPIVGTLTLVVAFLAWRNRRELPKAWMAFWAVVFFLILQIALGGVTIFASNDPPSVTAHWTCGMLLFGSLIALAILAWGPTAAEQPSQAGSSATPWLWLAAIAALLTTGMGAYVSSSGFGLTCAGFPSCDGHWFGLPWPQGAQMTHRALAYAVFFFAVAAVVATHRTQRRDLRAISLAALALVALQILLGVANVIGQLPMPLRESHAANAALLYATYVVLLVRSAFLPQAGARRA
ncbi:MAG TPA: COX15/CtaA family protein [Candidatus Dormibacteraeota bacterium]|nr:COX15/CtaA family protein [Candidatus Dormibacteraeota bacterium]